MAGKRKGRRALFRRSPPFIQQYDEWLASAAYRSLSCNARCLLQEFQRIHKPGRNGRLSISVERACGLLGLRSGNTARKAFRELEERGFVALSENASYIAGRAREYRLTIEECDGRAPTDDWKAWSPTNPVLSIGRQKLKIQNDPSKSALSPRNN